MRPPFRYWGGKQLMLKHILPLIPSHTCYIEPFCGGAAVFFAKEPAPVNIINDINEELVNFYEVLRSPQLRAELYAKLKETPYARSVFRKAIDLLSNSKGKTKVERAWAVFTGVGQGFRGLLGTGWWLSYGRGGRRGMPATFQRKITLLRLAELRRLISGAYIENRDACKVIGGAKSKDAFIYADPPYIDTNQGHYGGYGHADYEQLLQTLEQTPAKFMLSSRPSAQLERYGTRNNWISKEFVMALSSGGAGAKKTEVLTMNYELV